MMSNLCEGAGVGLPPHASQLLKQATQHATACGAGRMVWRCWGQGRPVVMLHGGAGSWMHWARNVETVVEAGWMACVPDLPGFGDSPVCGDDVDGMVEPLAAGILELLGKGRQDIVAFSLGTLLAVLLARARPELVVRLLLVAPLALPLLPRAGVALKPWRGLALQEEREAVHRQNLELLMFHAPGAIDGEAVHIQQWNSQRDRVRGRRLATTSAFLDNFAHLQCDMAAVFGREDVLFRDRWPRLASALGANPQMKWTAHVPGAGHWVQYEKADHFNEILRRWLASGTS